jgi:putative phage-type endonuclease
MELYAPKEFNGAKLVGVFEPNTPEWHEARAESLGGSEIGTILGLNPWESALSLWAKKTGKIDNPPINNWAVRFGQAFEEPILKLWEQEHPDWELFKTGTYQHPLTTSLHANPDALARHKQTGEWIIVEVKTARTSMETLPPHYDAQVRHYMMVMGIERSCLVAVAGMTWQEFWIERDAFVEEMILSAASNFVLNILQDQAPNFDGSDSTYETVRKLHPDIEDTEVEIDGAHQLLALQEKYDEAKANLTEAKSRVMDLMGKARHAYIEVDGKKIRVASRQARADGLPYLLINKKAK